MRKVYLYLFFLIFLNLFLLKHLLPINSPTLAQYETCGDGICDPSESCANCSVDCNCPPAPECDNDTYCEGDQGETCENCSDCGSCGYNCGLHDCCDGPVDCFVEMRCDQPDCVDTGCWPADCSGPCSSCTNPGNCYCESLADCGICASCECPIGQTCNTLVCNQAQHNCYSDCTSESPPPSNLPPPSQSPEPQCGDPTVICDCNDTGYINISWSIPTGTDSFALRVNDLDNGWPPHPSYSPAPVPCNLVNDDPLGNLCLDGISNSTNFFGRQGISGNSYSIWLHAVNDVCLPDPWAPYGSCSTTCPQPAYVQGRVNSAEQYHLNDIWEPCNYSCFWNQNSVAALLACAGYPNAYDYETAGLQVYCGVMPSDWFCNGNQCIGPWPCGGAFYKNPNSYEENDYVNCSVQGLPPGYVCYDPDDCDRSGFLAGGPNNWWFTIGKGYDCTNLNLPATANPGETVTITTDIFAFNDNNLLIDEVQYWYTLARANPADYCGLGAGANPATQWVNMGSQLTADVTCIPGTGCGTSYSWDIPSTLPDGTYTLASNVFGLDAWCTGNPGGSCNVANWACEDCFQDIDIICVDEPPDQPIAEVVPWVCDYAATFSWDSILATSWGNNCGLTADFYYVYMRKEGSSYNDNDPVCAYGRNDSVSTYSCNARATDWSGPGTYYYKVRASNNGNDFTNPLTWTDSAEMLFVRENIPPTPPENLDPSGDIETTNITLTWDPPQPPPNEPAYNTDVWGCNLNPADWDNHFTLWLRPNNNGFTNSDLVDGSCGAFTCGEDCTDKDEAQTTCGPNTDLIWGTTYYWQVRACNSASVLATDPFDPDFCALSLVSFTPYPGSWFQTAGGNVYASGTITSYVPNTATNRFFMGNLLFSPAYILSHGIPSGGGLDVGLDIPTQWAQSDPQWEVTSYTYTGEIYNYAWWADHLRDEVGATAWSSANLAGITNGVYNLAAGVTDLYGSFPANTQVAILSDHSIDISNNITVPVGSFLMVVVQGDITVNQGVTGNMANPPVQGIFIADDVITIEDSPLETIADQFVGAGSFIGWGGVILDRSIGNVDNVTNPALIFVFRPDFIINAPDYVKTIYFSNWQQVKG
ncbi:hypothetical protein ACFLZ1_04235 [Patescibacteria group bacterium]